MKRVCIYVDDMRNPPDRKDLREDCVVLVCRDYQSALDTIRWCRDVGWDFYLDLDHDLGGEKSGYDLCKMIIQEDIPVSLILLHTMNPVGRMNMVQLMKRYGYNLLSDEF